MKNNIYILLVIFIIISSCGSNQSESNTTDNNRSTKLYIELWEIFNGNYAFFDLRGINWKDERKKGLEKVQSITNDSLLFEEFCNILKKFDDSHINLESDKLKLNCNAGNLPEFYKEFPTNETFTSFLNARNKTLERVGIEKLTDSRSRLFQYGINKEKDWGYLRIKRFYGQDLETVQTELSNILLQFKNVKKLICDIRVNPGGNDETALLCAGFFFKQKEVAFYKKTRKRERQNYYSQLDTTFVYPKGETPLKVEHTYLLTNEASGSSADIFALVMSYLPQLTIIGTNTEGIFSNMYRDTLSNGWRVTLSNEIYYSKDMICFEGVGVPVDIKVKNKKKDTDMGIDLVIEKILEKL